MKPLERHDLAWCLRRTPMPVLKLMKAHGAKIVAAGGFIRSCITNERPNDIDLFFPSKDLAQVFAHQLVTGEGRKIDTPNAYTILNKHTFPIQCIHRWTYKEPESLLQSFDFTIARASFWWDTGELVWHSICDRRFYPDLAAKRLVYCLPFRNEDAGGSMLRILKFYQKGYRIPLDSLGDVIARLMQGVDQERLDQFPGMDRERQLSKVLTGLFREVDPNIDPDHLAHLPADNTPLEEPEI